MHWIDLKLLTPHLSLPKVLIYNTLYMCIQLCMDMQVFVLYVVYMQAHAHIYTLPYNRS